MDNRLFKNLMRKPPDQNPTEWFRFLTLVEGYFQENKIRKPLVVEIGVRKNRQKIFYERLLGCRHIGIDINAVRRPDIIGNSHNRRTFKQLLCALKHRTINLLFIDGDHSYQGVKADLKMYGMLTFHLIAVHDIHCKNKDVEVSRLWQELKLKTRLILVEIFNPEDKTFEDMGIGVIVKK